MTPPSAKSHVSFSHRASFSLTLKELISEGSMRLWVLRKACCRTHWSVVHHLLPYIEAPWGYSSSLCFRHMAQSQMAVPPKEKVFTKHHLLSPNFQVWKYPYSKVWPVILQIKILVQKKQQTCRFKNNRTKNLSHGESLRQPGTLLSPHQDHPYHSIPLANRSHYNVASHIHRLVTRLRKRIPIENRYRKMKRPCLHSGISRTKIYSQFCQCFQ